MTAEGLGKTLTYLESETELRVKARDQLNGEIEELQMQMSTLYSALDKIGGPSQSPSTSVRVAEGYTYGPGR